MNLFAITSLSCGVSCLILAVIAIIFGKTKIHRVLAFLNIAVAIWGFGCFVAGIADTESMAIFGWKFAHIGGALVAVLFFHLVCLFCKIQRKALLIFGYLQAIFFNLISWGLDAAVTEVRYIYGLYYNVAGHFIVFIILAYVLLVSLSFYELTRLYKRAKGDERVQSLYMMIGFAFGFIGGTSTFLPEFKIDILYPAGNFGIVVYSFFVTYAILKHRLMDIEVILKKTLVFASLFTVAFGIIVGITLLIQELFTGGRILGLAISSAIIIFMLRPLETFLIRVTDKYLFQKKYDYKHSIRDFMEKLKVMVLNAEEIAQSTLVFLDESIRPIFSAVFMSNKFTNKYDIVASVNFRNPDFKIPDTSNLINRLKTAERIVNLNEDKILTNEDKKELSSLGIELLIPLMVHRELLGILSLGKKKSDEGYLPEDIEVLLNLSSALSIALNNAQLFDERADAEKRAMIGTLATGINHEIGNPLNVISVELQTFNILAKQGFLAKKTKQQIIDRVDSIVKTCMGAVRRISDITKTISIFAKPDKELIFTKVNLNEVIDNTISFLEHELSLEKIQIKKNIISLSPFIVADKGQIGQIFFNLIKNAAQANNKEKGRIEVTIDNFGDNEIVAKISDNGPGIPQEQLNKIFIPFYTTKEPGKGTGLGLSLVHSLVERNNGSIDVQSEEGKGTTFTLLFKRS